MATGASSLSDTPGSGGASAEFNRAAKLHQQGHLDTAARRYAGILAENPSHAPTLHMLGILKHQQNDNEAALALLERAARTDGTNPLYLLNLGIVQLATGLLEQSCDTLTAVLERAPDHMEARFRRGIALNQRGMLDEAESDLRAALANGLKDHNAVTAYGALMDIEVKREQALPLKQIVEEAVKRFPRESRLLHVSADALRRMEQFRDAIPLYEKAIELDPAFIAPYCNLGVTYSALKEFDKSRDVLKRAIRRRGDMPVLYNSLASTEYAADNYQGAVDQCERVLEIDPDNSEAYNMIGRSLAASGMYEDAIAAYRKALELNPDTAAALINMGSALHSLGLADQAIDWYQIALSREPGLDLAYWNLSLSLLAVGQIEEGWDLYSYGFASRQRQPYRPFPGMLWDGTPAPDKTVMVWREQGIGDDLRFSSAFHDIEKRVGKLIIETDARLVPLYQRTWPEALVRTETRTSTGLGNMEGDPDFDLAVPAGLAASYVRRTLDDFPAEPGHLVPCPERAAAFAKWLETLGPGPKIGLSWRSRLRTAVRNYYYTELTDWLELLRTEGVHFVNLQYDGASEDIAALKKEHGLIVHEAPDTDLMNDLDGAAALTSVLDAVVSAGTSVADMAGAVGAPTFMYTMQRHQCMLGQDNIPWAPSVRVYGLHPGFTAREDYVSAITQDCRAFIAGLEKDA